jgi:hypothetical protein
LSVTHGGGAWLGHLLRANLKTLKPDLPTHNQYFSTVYSPVKFAIRIKFFLSC